MRVLANWWPLPAPEASGARDGASHKLEAVIQIEYPCAFSSPGDLIRSDGFSSDTTVCGATLWVSHTLEPMTA